MIQCYDQLERQVQRAALMLGRVPVLGVGRVGPSGRNRVQIVVVALQITGARAEPTDEQFDLEFGSA